MSEEKKIRVAITNLQTKVSDLDARANAIAAVVIDKGVTTPEELKKYYTDIKKEKRDKREKDKKQKRGGLKDGLEKDGNKVQETTPV